MNSAAFDTKACLILASTSPRRAELLRDAGYRFRVIGPHLQEPEQMGSDVPPYAQAEALGYFKARSVAQRVSSGVILAADTVVAHSGTVFGKPVDRNDARRILQHLAGTTHEVITGVTVIDTENDTRLFDHARTQVTMHSQTPEAIEKYLDTGGWQGKAGAYGIQDKRDAFIGKIKGSFTNVVGLPMELVGRMLSQVGIDATVKG